MILLVILKLIIKQPFKSFPIKERFDVAKNRRASNYKHDLGFILSACRMVSSVTISFIPSRSVGTGVKCHLGCFLTLHKTHQ
jgi:hypothetical protein